MIGRLFQKDALTAAGGWLGSEENDPTLAGSCTSLGTTMLPPTFQLPVTGQGHRQGAPEPSARALLRSHTTSMGPRSPWLPDLWPAPQGPHLWCLTRLQNAAV